MRLTRRDNVGTVLICGAGIAGTVLAYRLARAGLRPTVVERSAGLRQAGNAVDLRGPAVEVMAEMGVLVELEARATQLGEFFRIDSSGKRVFTMAPEVIGGEIELLRTELNAVLFGAAQAGVEYRFGDSIRSLDDRGDGVGVTFDSGRRGDFDLVIGADGLHSRTRALAFGPETEFVRHLGCYQAHFTTDNILGLHNAGLLFNRPGRTLGCYTVHQSQELVIGLFFESAQCAYDRADVAAQRCWINRTFDGMGWRAAELLEAMQACDDFYFDAIAQVSLASPYRGRVALVGDAAYGPSLLSGMGATLAVVGAAVLADELSCHPDDHRKAFARYEARIRDMTELSQELARASLGWFIQSDDVDGISSDTQLVADRESGVLRDRTLAAVRAACGNPSSRARK
ncbi:hypothetical protein BKG76_03035 [Mycobacteroides franklinii]|uniref:FAD-binding domain-containing protein n=1 Tax=Mycobacteroides franklinii TaxID=948102 RepID=A0A1S1LE65_9MYCO|nr:FAD-dependent monooxygenase [Mycobacteroides franklinii]OHU30720.1 hypothetical protein BKG76_03035 [Mycobacteroides franklinii]